METLQWNSFVLLYWDDHVGSTESKYRCEPHWSDQTVTLFFFFQSSTLVLVVFLLLVNFRNASYFTLFLRYSVLFIVFHVSTG